jgi:hypothetical protein
VDVGRAERARAGRAISQQRCLCTAAEPIVPDRLRQVAFPSTLTKSLFYLDHVKMTVFSTVFDSSLSSNAMCDKDLAIQLMIEWE